MKVFIFSDLHIDYQGNFDHLLSFKAADYHDAALLVAGDVSDNLGKLEQLLTHFKRCFAEVAFVPGNHELWLRKTPYKDSVDKFNAIIALCQRLGVRTTPFKWAVNSTHPVWIVPLFSWYTKADEGIDSLYQPKPGDDQTEFIWSDNALCRWDQLGDTRPVDYFLKLNDAHLQQQYDAPVISFSHFLPLTELVFRPGWVKPKNFVDPMPYFNFTRVAGTTLLHQQIQQLGSQIHVYGHQHRNRHTHIDSTTYISHCLGYPKERNRNSWRGNDKPKLIWHHGEIPLDQPY